MAELGRCASFEEAGLDEIVLSASLVRIWMC